MKSGRLLGAVIASVALAMGAQGSEEFFSVLPAGELNAAVPALRTVTGADWGESIASAEQVVGYARALAAGSPRTVRLEEYARSIEGRPLVLLLIGSAQTIAKLDEVRSGLARLGDSRVISGAEANRLIGELPPVVWIQASVHGDEASGADASLALAYTLAASSASEVARVRDRLLVVIDPVQNPDGRARFVASNLAARGAEANADPAAAEHTQPWPGGRVSHDLFDLNRDWFALTHPETRGRVAAMLRTPPTVVVDLHEMGAEMGYFFAPPAKPFHPLLGSDRLAMWDLVAHANAAAFDAQGWRYWTREVFDSFYPGYGESWPEFTGSIGMTYEEASSRGLVVTLKDGTRLTYKETVQHHLVSSFATCSAVAADPQRFLRAWYSFRASAVADGQKGDARAVLLGSGEDQLGVAELAYHLAAQGIEVGRTTQASSGCPTGSYVVPLAQPLGRLARVLLDKGATMGADFEKEQERRDHLRLPDEIYDLTAWSLPLLWEVPARTLAAVPAGLELLHGREVGPGQLRGDGTVAFLLPWQGTASAQALAGLLRQSIKASVATKPLAIAGQAFGRGTIVVRRIGNGKDLKERLGQIAAATGVDFIGVDTGYADSGIDLGSTNVVALAPPRVALLWDTPTSAISAGQLRYVLDRLLGYPVTAVRASSFGQFELGHYDVLILPDTWGEGAGLARVFGEDAVKRISAWVAEGGTLVAVGNSAAFLCGEKVGLLASKLEKRGATGEPPEKGKPTDSAKEPGRSFDYDHAVRPEEEEPPAVPGAILQADLDGESVLAAGFPGGSVNVLATSRRIFAPLKLDRGTNIGVWAGADHLVQAGFVLSASREQLPRKAYLLLQPNHRGRVIAFAEDPAARGMTRATIVLLANAVFFGQAL